VDLVGGEGTATLSIVDCDAQRREETGSERRAPRPRRALAHRAHGDDGAVIVEAAIIGPIFFVVVFAIMEFGIAYANYLSLGNVVRAAARQEAIQGNAVSADWATLQSIKRSKGMLDMSRVEQIVIFKADTPQSGVPVNCKTSSQSGVCNRFTASQWNDALGSSWTCSTPAIQSWCPSSRSVSFGNTTLVGVYIEYRHSYITKLFGNTVTLSETSIAALEPQTVG
jgi:Flp pilus assembly protein TadG